MVAQNTTTLAQQNGFDAATIGQLQMIQNGVNQAIIFASTNSQANNNNNNGYYPNNGGYPNSGGYSNSGGYPNNGFPPNGYNPSNGFYPNNGGRPGANGGLTLLNTARISNDQVTVTWSLPTGGTSTYISKPNSYMLSDGNSIRVANGFERNLLNVVYAQSGGFTPSNGGDTHYHPANPNVVNATASGKGQFMMMGRSFLNIRNATVESSDPVSRRGTFSMFGGRETMSFLGTVVARNHSNFTFNVDGSDRGAASGTLTCMIGFDGRLSSVQGNGVLNGQPYIITFKEQ